MEEYSLKYDSGNASWIQDELICRLKKHCVKEYCDDPECCHWACYLKVDGDCCSHPPTNYTHENCFPKCCELQNNMCYHNDDEMWCNHLIIVCSCGWVSNEHDDGSYDSSGESDSARDMNRLYGTAWYHVLHNHTHPELDDYGITQDERDGFNS